MKKYFNTIILFGSLAFLVMWVDQFLYKDVAIKDSYFFLMFALAGFLFYTYRKGIDKQKEALEKKDEEEKAKKPIIKATIGNKKSKK
ncbi:hypothetical protein SAMN06298216_3823 [Spirosomataceae bacterium TFI 002]|nr:hypothetical protein SAMN06298216_3823 [Spirosomataceae bacterium TFI 002]